MSETTSTQVRPIFVYGTLRPGAMQHSIIRGYMEKSQPATIQGYQMYRFGRFPGVVRRPSTPLPVRGELIYIKSDVYEECLVKLDKYESAGWLFDRVEEFAQLDYFIDPVPCWLYVANEDNLIVSENNLVRENDWFEAHRG